MDTAKLDNLIKYCYSRGLTYAEIESFMGEVDPELFCDAFSRRIAHEYAAGRLTFEAADAAINRLFAYGFSQLNSGLPPYSMDVFTAFDDGEYCSSSEPPGTDPEAKYTRPQILEIVGRDLTG